MNQDTFTQQVESLYGRLTNLYQDAIASGEPKANLLPAVFMELGTASETLEVATKRLSQQTQELAIARARFRAEHRRYQDLCDLIPNAYLVSDTRGKIQEANRAAATLFNVEQEFLLNKPLVCFIPLDERQAFRNQLSRLSFEYVQEWRLRIQPRHSEPFDAALTVSPVRDFESNLTVWRWIIRDITESKRALLALQSNEYDPTQDRPKYNYCKGDIIPLQPKSIWLVSQGLVKLSTMNETGEEVFIGLAGPSMPFGSSITSLPIYQVTSLSPEVELVCISLEEIAASPRLAQALLPQISARVRQAELLLNIAGKRRVSDRLYYLLLWLTQEFGEPVAQGTRLSVRLTHQDLADACCTTRVTVTRELNKLQQQRKILFDSKHHIIFSSTFAN
ncbi:PAS domain-containing protein [Nostoc sp. UHCC 0302]|uniref:PAS domain S-box protein n=1 Tax=Nostoc sp. UHCC 0302 TaxID=3134896 RepID=UPI00311C9CAC